MNAPIGTDRAVALTDSVATMAPTITVDFGCGRGGFLRRLASALPVGLLIGVDSDAEVVQAAETLAADAGQCTRLRFVCADAADWGDAADAAICIGSSHAFGGPAPMLSRLHQLGCRSAIIGDGYWASEPSEWCLENLGEMPRGLAALHTLAESAGWRVAISDSSTIDEWDAFEGRWCEGVRELGSEAANAFADERTEQYQRYRGMLGFGWMRLVRSG